MHAYAQTNIQLFNQLSRSGYSKADIEYLYRAYELAIRLFTGHFHASGKTFIAHLVGTASILATLRAPIALVTAGLLHAAYAQGDFGTGRKGISGAKREKLKQALGEEAEQYIARYTAQPWNEQAISMTYDKIDTLTAIERDIILLCLANTLEDYLDLGIFYYDEPEQQGYGRYTDTSAALQIGIAKQLGFPNLAAELTRAFDEHATVDIPHALRRANQFSFMLPPGSYQRRPTAFLHIVLAACLRRLKAVLR